jgi:hypothetical protein
MVEGLRRRAGLVLTVISLYKSLGNRGKHSLQSISRLIRVIEKEIKGVYYLFVGMEWRR